uniref:HAUS augmin like complex subunit 4 n=1 Tax=Ornithorhynchus anatinus TaxID=9258 RepID=A0A6I8PCK5_ORNAN
MASGDFCSPVEGLELLQKVCGHQLPPCQIGEEDLLHNPHFAKLLLSLAQRLDGTGLSNALAEEQAQAWKDVRLQKTMWLRSEVLHRVIQEMLVDYYVRARDANLTPEDRKDSRLLQERLLPAVEEGLKKKCFSLLCYHDPNSDSDTDTLKAAKVWKLAETLTGEKQQRQDARSQQKEQIVLLEKQRATYSQALLRCLALLQKLLQEHRLETQAELDRKHTQYLEVKCKAMILKLRMEELQVLSDTYPAEKVEVHRIIRDSLEEATRTQEQDLENSRRLLGAYEVLGAEFDGLVQEYAQLRQEIDNKRWAIREFDKSCH